MVLLVKLFIILVVCILIFVPDHLVFYWIIKHNISHMDSISAIARLSPDLSDRTLLTIQFYHVTLIRVLVKVRFLTNEVGSSNTIASVLSAEATVV